MDAVNRDRPFLVVAYDHLGRKQAGPARRTLALARELGKIGPVEVVFEGDPPEGEMASVRFTPRESIEAFPDFFSRFRAALAPPLVALTLPELLESDIPLAIDLFDPVIWENLELYRHEPEPEQFFQHERHLAALLAALFRGDFFLVAGERQLDLFCGALMALNRVNPGTWRPGEGPEQLIGLVPFGLPDSSPPSPDQAPLPDGYEPDRPLVVWGGGMWDWLNPELVVRSWPDVIKARPDALLVFPGTEHPNPHVPVMASVGRVRKLAKELGVIDHLRFGRWLERKEYIGLLAHAGCGVSAHARGLEARYAARTRFLDAIWMGLPMVVTEGDEYSEFLAARGLGEVVRSTEADVFANAVVRVLDSGKHSYDERFVEARTELTWSRMAGPLIKWAETPRKTHGTGMEFFRATVGDAAPRGRPGDLGSLLKRLVSKLSRG